MFDSSVHPVWAVVWVAVQVKTSDLRGAGTDANVSVTLMGSACSSGPHRLVSIHTLQRVH